MNRNEAERGTRMHGKHLRAPVLPSEEPTIKENASKASLTVAEYLRRLSLGYEITSMIDSQYVAQIAKINADQGRLGGLPKLWLPDDADMGVGSGAKSH